MAFAHGSNDAQKSMGIITMALAAYAANQQGAGPVHLSVPYWVIVSCATAMALGKVYSFGPTFRAEKSKTRRHLTEFWMVEPEIAYAGLDDIMELAENFISHIVQSVVANRRARQCDQRSNPRSARSNRRCTGLSGG